jgi:uncharacterized protein YhjY with autotransporter beta-barrel domain
LEVHVLPLLDTHEELFVKAASALFFLFLIVATLAAQSVVASEAPTNGSSLLGVLQIKAAPGDEVEQDFFVPGPYPVTADTDLGSVSPAVFTEEGFVNFFYQVPVDAEVGSFQQATIFLNDAAGGVRAYVLQIEVIEESFGGGFVVSGALNLAGLPGETVTYRFSILPDDNLPITLSSTLGGFTPDTFTNVASPTFSTYSYTIPTDAPPGGVLNGVITFTETFGSELLSTQLAVNVIVLGDEFGTVFAEDDLGSIDGASGGVAIANVLGNDVINDLPATNDLVLLTTLSNDSPLFLDLNTGAVLVPAGTAPGTYTLVYQICDVQDPENCSTAAAVVQVTGAGIVANDDFGSVEAATGGVAVANVLANDTLDGVAATLETVAITQLIPISPLVTLDVQTGSVSLAAGVAAGSYGLQYQICDRQDPQRCDDASVTVSAVGPPILRIDAVDDFGIADATTGGIAITNVLENDTVNGEPATFDTVVITGLASVTPGISLNVETGAVSVAPGSDAVYAIEYTICEIANPDSCDSATASVSTIGPPLSPIDAVDDVGSVTSAGGVAIASVLANDTLRGEPATLSNVTLTRLAGGDPALQLDLETGAVQVAPGLTPRISQLVYRICEIDAPDICDDGVVNVEVVADATIAANDDSGTVNVSTGGVAVANVLTNDTINGEPATLDRVQISVVSIVQPLTFDTTTGAVSVPAGSASGSYSLTYQICDLQNQANCDQASVAVQVLDNTIVANDDVGTAVEGTGGVVIANVLANDTLNGAPATFSTVFIDSAAATSGALGIDFGTGAVNVSSTAPPGTYFLSYRICERGIPQKCANADVSVTVTAAAGINAADDFGSISNLGGEVLNVLANDTVRGQPAAVNNNVVLSVLEGNPIPQLNLQTGAVQMPPGVAPGTYVLGYQICDTADPSVCDEALVTVTVTAAEIVAEGDFTVAAVAGGSASITFSVGAAAYPVSIAAATGAVSPATLSGPGQVTYSLTVPETTPIGTVIDDVITLTDANQSVRTVPVEIEVVTPEQQSVGETPDLTPNQQELGVVVDARCEDATSEDLILLCERLRNPDNTDEQIAEALEAINPEETLAASVVAVRVVSVQQNNISQRISSLRTGTSQPGIDVSGLTLRSGDTIISGAALSEMLQSLTGGAAGDDFGRWGFFVDGNINYGEKSRTQSDAGFDFDGLGITSGLDYRLGDNIVLGGALGYSVSDVGFRGAGGNLDVESWNLTLFGSWFVSDRYYVDGQINYGRTDYDSLRRVRFEDASGTFDRTARGATDGTQLSGAIAGGYDFNRGAWTFGPHVSLNLLDAEVKAMQEQGADSLNMRVGQQDSRSLTASVGGHLNYAYNTSWGVLLPHLRFDWTREFETDVTQVQVNFADDALATYLMRGDRVDPSYFLWSAGVSAQFIRGFSGFVNFQQMVGFGSLELSQFNYGMRYERAF